MDRSDLYTLIGSLTNDPSHERYSTTDLDTELDNSQDKWNIHAKIIKDTVTLTVVDGTNDYAISGLTGTPIEFLRVTHKGVELVRRDKSYFDMFASDDWSDDTGTPKYYYIDASDPDSQKIYLYPIPRSEDAGANLVVEYVKRHTPMASDSSLPFNDNSLLVPYHWGLAYDVSSRLLARDPSAENVAKADAYNKQANNVLAEVIQTFKAQEREQPLRVRPIKRWPQH